MFIFVSEPDELYFPRRFNVVISAIFFILMHVFAILSVLGFEKKNLHSNYVCCGTFWNILLHASAFHCRNPSSQKYDLLFSYEYVNYVRNLSSQIYDHNILPIFDEHNIRFFFWLCAFHIWIIYAMCWKHQKHMNEKITSNLYSSNIYKTWHISSNRGSCRCLSSRLKVTLTASAYISGAEWPIFAVTFWVVITVVARSNLVYG